MPTPGSARLLARCALGSLLALLGAACGEAEPTAPLAVLQRGLAWERLDPVTEPLTLAWTAAAGLEAWTVPDRPTPAPADGALRLALEAAAPGAPDPADVGQAPRARLDSPVGAPLDPVLHHWLTVQGTTTMPLTLRVLWRSQGEAFSDERASTLMTVPASPDPQTWSVPLASLRAAREAGDVSEGVEQFRLVFRAPAGSGADSVSLHSIALASDFDLAGDGPLPHHRLGYLGVLREGVALRAPGGMGARFTPGPHDRLRLGLALAGSPTPAEVTIRDTDGELPPVTVRCTPGAEWQDVALDLAPLRGRPTHLIVEVTEAPRPYTTLLVGGVMLLGPDGKELPDVVFYLEDTLRADHLATYGHLVPTDPHLQRIAQDGAVFEQAFSASSWTRPSVSTIHTSLDPLAHGNLTFGDRVADAVDTLAETLGAQGYLTAAFVTNYHGGSWAGLDQGFDEAHEPTAHGTTRVTSTLTSAAVADPIDRFLTEHAGERVFVFVQSLDPHAPYEPLGADHYSFLRAAPTDEPAAPMNPTKQAHQALALRYDAEILHNDRYLERLDATLEATGRAPRTLFMFASDHGEAFGEHGQVEHRKTLHQEELHIPWVVRWPGVVDAGHRVDAWVGHIDMAPTILGLLDVDVPPGWKGRDLSGLLTTHSGDRAEPDLEQPLLVHMVHEDESTQSIAVVWAPYKLVMPLDEAGQPVGPGQLLDLAADPGEQNPIPLDDANSRAGIAATALEQWARRTLAESRASAVRGEAEPMSPAMREWMRAMGYL